jgi:hypothetical protein
MTKHKWDAIETGGYRMEKTDVYSDEGKWYSLHLQNVADNHGMTMTDIRNLHSLLSVVMEYEKLNKGSTTKKRREDKK